MKRSVTPPARVRAPTAACAGPPVRAHARGVAAEGVGAAAHGLHGDAPAPVRSGQGVPGEHLHEFRPLAEPQVGAVRTGRLGEAYDGPAVRFPPQVREGRVQMQRTDGPRRGEVEGRPRDRLGRDGQAAVVGAQPGPGGDGQQHVVDRAGPHGEVRVLADPVRCRGVADVPRGERDRHAVAVERVFGPGHQVEGVAGLRPERGRQHHPALRLLHRLPRRPAQQTVDGVGVFDLVERQLRLPPLPAVPAVADPVGPRHQELPASALDRVVGFETVDDRALADGVVAQGAAQFHDDGGLRTTGQPELSSRPMHVRHPRPWRPGSGTARTGCLSRSVPESTPTGQWPSCHRAVAVPRCCRGGADFVSPSAPRERFSGSQQQ